MRTARLALTLATTVVGLSLTAVAPAHAAATVSPTSGTNEGTKTFTVSGVPATTGEAVVLKLAGQPDITGTVERPDEGPLCALGVSDSDCGSVISVSVPLLNAYPGAYDVVRTQTSALGGGDSTSTLSAAFSVKSLPVITSVAPATRGQDSSSQVTITGTGFGPGSVVSLGDGITVSDVARVDATTLTANVEVPAAAPLGARALTVTSADGLSDTQDSALTVTPKPTLTSITPASGKRGEGLTGVVLAGTGFASGGDFAVTINGVAVSNPVVSGDGTTVTANLTVSEQAVSGNRTVLLTNSDGGRARLTNGFRVIAPPAAPVFVAALAGDGKALVAWTASSDQGSSPITQWVITPSGGVPPVTAAANATSVTVGGLTNGTLYSFEVVAKNVDAGAGAPKTTAQVTPRFATTLTATSSRATAIATQSTIVSGYLKKSVNGTPISGAQVKLKIAPAVGASTTRALTTDAAGRWSTTVLLSYTTTFSASYEQTATTQARNAPSLVVPVAVKITLTSPAASSVVGTSFTARGSVSPNKAGRSISLYKVVNGTTIFVARGTVASNATYAIPARLTRGNYVLRVVLAGTNANSQGQSPPVFVKVR